MTGAIARLLITCPDARGIVAAVTGFIAEHDGNILDLDQHTDPEHGEFFMRVAVEQNGFHLNNANFENAFTPLAQQHNLQWWLYWSNNIKRMAILVSRQGHCLHDLLWRHKAGELEVGIPLIISNHDDLRDVVDDYNLPFHVLPVTSATKAAQEQQIVQLLEDNRVDFVVLARYMQILSPGFAQRYAHRVINIHHSFLPAFAGARPYHQAYDRGVKIIGATSHYITEQLDQGPIIAQQTLSVDHRDTVEDLIRKGRDLERTVLAQAVRLHVEDKILVSRNKTVVFD